jgi:hypothetical protein
VLEVIGIEKSSYIGMDGWGWHLAGFCSVVPVTIIASLKSIGIAKAHLHQNKKTL